MIDLHLNLFGVILDLSLIIPKRKKKVKQEEKPETSVLNENKTPISISEFFYDESEDVLETTQEPSQIETQASIFEKELRSNAIYDIPSTSDIPPKHQINDDVEVITESFEKELEDLYEGRR